MTVGVLHNYLVVGAILFCLGAIGFLTRRNLIVLFLSGEMMLQGVALSLVAFGAHQDDFQGQAFVLFILTVAACEAALALALILSLYRRKRTLDVSVWQLLREADQDPIVDTEPLPREEEEFPQKLPTLAPAGLRPASSAREVSHG